MSMTRGEIKTKFDALVDNDLDDDLKDQLVMDAIHEIEMELSLEINKKENTSNTTSVGQTYTTAISLPSDFLALDGVHIYVGTVPYMGVPFKKRAIYKDSPGYFYINQAARTLHLCGRQGSSQTITIPYVFGMTDFDDDDDTPTAWPSQFHSIIPIWMAVRSFPIDAAERERSWFGEWNELLTQGLNRMRDWDIKIKLANQGGASHPRLDDEGGIALGDM